MGSEESAQKVADQINKLGGEGMVVKCDTSKVGPASFQACTPALPHGGGFPPPSLSAPSRLPPSCAALLPPQPEEIQRMFDEVVAKWGTVDVLVNNA